jgi:hypothetical protein
LKKIYRFRLRNDWKWRQTIKIENNLAKRQTKIANSLAFKITWWPSPKRPTKKTIILITESVRSKWQLVSVKIKEIKNQKAKTLNHLVKK